MSTQLKFSTREEWLTELAKRLEPRLRHRAGLRIPRGYKIACGWPSRGGTSHKHRTIGQCWPASDRNAEMFISPTLDDPVEVGHVTLHEMIHAALPPEVGHRKAFSQAAKKCGLDGPNSKPTATTPNDELVADLKLIIDDLGPYPHKRLDPGGPKDKGRMRLIMCPECGAKYRTTTKWIEENGAPLCNRCGIQMLTDDEIEGEVEVPISAVERTIEYAIKGTERFRLRMTATNHSTIWFVIDYMPETVTAVGVKRFEVQPARLTPAESQEDALNIVTALLEGLTTYEKLEDEQGDIDIDGLVDGEPDEDEDWRDLQLLDDDEEETADFEDGTLSDEEYEAYEAESELREAA
jgi:hypothetical protein